MAAGPNNWAYNTDIKLILSFLILFSKSTADHQGAPFISLYLLWSSLPEDRWLFSWELEEHPGWELRYSRWWSGTATSCGASWTLSGSSSGPPHSGKPWSWSPPSPLHLYSARGQKISQCDGSWWNPGKKTTWQTSRFHWNVQLCARVAQLSLCCHGYHPAVPSWRRWVCWRSRVVCFGSTPLRRDQVCRWSVFSAATQQTADGRGCVTQGEEGPLQISFHLLPDALLDVVRTVALVPPKHCQQKHNRSEVTLHIQLSPNFIDTVQEQLPSTGRNLEQDRRPSRIIHADIWTEPVWSYWEKKVRSKWNMGPFWRWGTLLWDMMEIQVATSVPFLFTPASYRHCQD